MKVLWEIRSHISDEIFKGTHNFKAFSIQLYAN